MLDLTNLFIQTRDFRMFEKTCVKWLWPREPKDVGSDPGRYRYLVMNSNYSSWSTLRERPRSYDVGTTKQC